MNRKRRKDYLPFGLSAVACVSVMLTAACSLPAIEPAREDTARYFVLAGTTGLQFGNTGIRVLPVRVPTYLQGRPIALRVAENEVRYSSDARWAEPLDVAITQLLRARLNQDSAGRDCTVQVLVQQCEATSGANGAVVFSAVFEITAGDKGAVPETHVFKAKPRSWSGEDYALLAVELRGAVNELSEAILAVLPGKM